MKRSDLTDTSLNKSVFSFKSSVKPKHKASSSISNTNFAKILDETLEEEQKQQFYTAKYSQTENEMLPQSYDKLLANKEEVYSEIRLHPFSGLIGCQSVTHDKNQKLLFPSPTYSPEMFLITPKTDKASIFNGVAIDKQLGVVVTDPEISAKFKGIMGEIITKFLKAKFTGGTFSLPVRIFEPKSTLHRITDYFVFFPSLLEKAYECTAPEERLKYVMAFAVAGLHISVTHLKPFNCILGETFEGKFSDGSSIYLESINNNPTTVRILVLHVEQKYSLSGWLEFHSMGDNFMGTNIKISPKGLLKVTFNYSTPLTISYTLPKIRLVNATSNINRGIHWVDNILFYDSDNALKGVVACGTKSKSVDSVYGGIYEYDGIYEFDEKYEAKEATKRIAKNNLDYTVSGSFLNSFCFDGEEYWNIDKLESHSVLCNERVLPSDGRFREDLTWLLKAFNATNPEDKARFENLS